MNTRSHALPDNVTTDQLTGAWVAVTKTMRDTSVTKEKRMEKIMHILKGITEVSPKSLEALLEISDYEWKLINNASPKVKNFYNKAHDLATDINFHKMDRDKKRAVAAKLLNSISETEDKEMEEITRKVMLLLLVIVVVCFVVHADDEDASVKAQQTQLNGSDWFGAQFSADDCILANRS
ncbi:hypothetical protein ANCCAN_07732 [Ancylostoma caninum]|uniref:Uncharacterized protein n=1 Tax=Ancylostoma caninum TaxID=29170 RepID=A0A368GPG4_ANCCA|nr:hypothetical protein ANCCAN_07732 [Ancylostoma caninum]